MELSISTVSNTTVYTNSCNMIRKNSAGVINFTLLKEIGDISINRTADKDTIFEMFDFYRECMGM